MKTIAILSSLVLCSCVTAQTLPKAPPYTGAVTLYGEAHGVQKILQKELDLWQGHYRTGARHLFVELPYYTGKLLNLWMHEESDTTLQAVYDDWEGTASHNPYSLEFFKNLKATCPLTIFHGTDVGHQYDTTGQRYLNLLEAQSQKDSVEYRTAQAVIDQGVRFYQGQNAVYRERAMVANFLRELESVGSSDVVGIYGAAHTGLTSLDYSGAVACMANQLNSLYPGQLRSQDLSPLAKEIDPLRTDTVTVRGRTYEAAYYGKEDLTGFRNYSYREFWRLEGAYADLKTLRKTGQVLRYNNFPMTMDLKQVYLVEVTLTDGTKKKLYFVSEGKVWQGLPSTEEVEVK